MSLTISKKNYANLFGPTTGDKVRLGDTDLFIEIEKDHNAYGDESKFGGGKSIRDGMGQSSTATRSQGVMGLLGLPVLCQQLITHGLPTMTPAAIVQQGTTHAQRVLVGSLETLPNLAASAKLTPPTLIIIGEVVKLHQNLAWFESGRNLYANAPEANKEKLTKK